MVESVAALGLTRVEPTDSATNRSAPPRRVRAVPQIINAVVC